MNNINKAIEKFVAVLSDRQRNVIEKRFGLNGKAFTLAAIGNQYGLTRERVRQIESSALDLIRKQFGDDKDFKQIFKVCFDLLEKNGEVMREKDFLEKAKDVLKNNSLRAEQIKFIFEIAKKPYYHIDDKNFYSFWYFGEKQIESAYGFIKKVEKFFAEEKKSVSHKELDKHLAKFVKTCGLGGNIALNYIAISKKFSTNTYGDFGLSKWDEINPKTARAKAFLILKKHGKPLHFKEINKKINDLKIGKRLALFQTIHNELIKDPRFVLVGRGTYGLADFGLKPGFAKEVIARILKEKGPLKKEQVIDLVKQERFLKENTILINLQSKKHFKRLSDGRYHLA
ncbi:hypothetical protein HZC33_00185 [Candidatus Wolfebacteria bacterium]|nr:hypothetical protein [Candidatus Wolfebacteria bacterium]